MTSYQLLSGGSVEASTILFTLQPLTGEEVGRRNPSRLGRRLVARQPHILQDDPQAYPAVVVSFSHPPRVGEDFVFGSDDATTDITMGTPGYHISAQHLRFGLDREGRVEMRDSSMLGTAVSYNRQPFQSRQGTLAKPFT